MRSRACLTTKTAASSAVTRDDQRPRHTRAFARSQGVLEPIQWMSRLYHSANTMTGAYVDGTPATIEDSSGWRQ
jgi:hypothetical protein